MTGSLGALRVHPERVAGQVLSCVCVCVCVCCALSLARRSIAQRLHVSARHMRDIFLKFMEFAPRVWKLARSSMALVRWAAVHIT